MKRAFGKNTFHKETIKAKTDLGQKKDMKGAKEREKTLKEAAPNQVTLSSHVPKLRDKLNARHFTQVTVS